MVIDDAGPKRTERTAQQYLRRANGALPVGHRWMSGAPIASTSMIFGRFEVGNALADVL